MQVDDEVKMLLSDLLDEFQQMPATIVRTFFIKKHTCIKIWILLHKVAQLLIRKKCDTRRRKVCPQGSKRRRHKH